MHAHTHTHTIMVNMQYSPPVVVHLKKLGGKISISVMPLGTAVRTWKSLNGAILSTSSGT